MFLLRLIAILCINKNLDGVDLCVIMLHAVNSRYETLEPMVPEIRKAVRKAKPGMVIHIGN